MKIQKKYKLIISIITIFSGIFFAVPVFASSLNLIYPDGILVKDQNYYADIMLDPQNENINTVSATISFSKNIIPISIDENGGIIGEWVETPKIISLNNDIHFAGIIPNGFAGYIDPFTPNVKFPAKILRIYFTVAEAGTMQLSAVDLKAYLNDGNGTETKLSYMQSALRISSIQKIPDNTIRLKQISSVYIYVLPLILFVFIIICVIILYRWISRKKHSK